MKLFNAIVCFLLPVRISFWLLNLSGNKVHPRAKIGFSFIWLRNKLILEKNARIGHANYMKADSLEIKSNGEIGSRNKFHGPINIILDEGAAIGNGNKFYRAPLGVTYGECVVRIGTGSKITANHRIDCTRNITIGAHSILAGHDSQFWTHGYYHDKTGPGRFRVDGEIVVGNNVYIGSRCVVLAGVKIGDAIAVGANSVVSNSLLEAGTYVNQALRYFPLTNDDARAKFHKVAGHVICEEVYEKKIS